MVGICNVRAHIQATLATTPTDTLQLLHEMRSVAICTDNAAVDSLLVAAILELRRHLAQLARLHIQAAQITTELSGTDIF